jgi:hypothetical protein
MTAGASCKQQGAIVPLDLPLGSSSGTCDWCGKQHKIEYRWVPGEGWVAYGQ